MLTSITTLDELAEKVKDFGFHLSRQTLYLHLLPRRKNSHHGRRHHHTVPVKLCRPQEDLRVKHPAARYCLALNRQLKQLASILGPDVCVWMGADDKAKVSFSLFLSPFLWS